MIGRRSDSLYAGITSERILSVHENHGTSMAKYNGEEEIVALQICGNLPFWILLSPAARVVTVQSSPPSTIV